MRRCVIFIVRTRQLQERIIQCEFLDFFSLDSLTVDIKITDLSIVEFKWENLQNQQCIEYLFSQLYMTWHVYVWKNKQSQRPVQIYYVWDK